MLETKIMENIIGIILMFITITIGGKYIALRLYKQKLNPKLSAINIPEKEDEKTAHLKLVYRQEELYDTMYFETWALFRDLMKSKALSSEQVKFIKFYLKDQVKDYKYLYQRNYKNDANEIYTLLKSPLLDNSHYRYLVTVLKDFSQAI